MIWINIFNMRLYCKPSVYGCTDFKCSKDVSILGEVQHRLSIVRQLRGEITTDATFAKIYLSSFTSSQCPSGSLK